MKKYKEIVFKFSFYIFFALFIANAMFFLYNSFSAGAKTITNCSTCIPPKGRIFSEDFFPPVLAILYLIFIALLFFAFRFYISSISKKKYLIVSDDFKIRARKNIYFTICANTVFIFLYLFLIKYREDFYWQAPIERLKSSKPFIFFVICDLFFVFLLLYRSFKLRKCIKEISCNQDNEDIKKSAYLLPYLLLVFLAFNQFYILGLVFFEDIEFVSPIFLIFNFIALIWIFLACQIYNTYCTQEQYNLLGVGLGSGIGTYHFSLLKTLFLREFFSYLFIFIVYFIYAIVVLSLFLPLVCTDSKLG